MNKTSKETQHGFTIIEVVLVLAIAALIMLMVFLALPALQRSQRDTQRKDDISRLQSAVNNFKSSNRGHVPQETDAAWENFVDQYMLRSDDTFADPSGHKYEIDVIPGSGDIDFSYALGGASNVDDMYKDDDAASKIYVRYGGTCNYTDQKIEGHSSDSRKLAFIKALEGGSYECRNA